LKKLFYFTESYPYGLHESWKTDELRYLSKYFEEIFVIPNNYGNSKEFQGFESENIFYFTPLFEELYCLSFRSKFISILCSKFIFLLLSEFLKEVRSFELSKFKELINSTYNILELSKNRKFLEIRKKITQHDVSLFFWGRGTSEYIGFQKLNGKSVIRYHGFDLYDFRHFSKYIPYQKRQIKNANLNLCISRHGELYLKNKFPNLQERIKLNYLGSEDPNIYLNPKKHTHLIKQSFTIISCSRLIPLKRMGLLMEALITIRSLKITWIHIGDGEERKMLEEKSRFLGGNINFKITGWLSHEEIFDLYLTESPQLFINLSETEGLPVSIVEACSCGIPIFATDVGGNSEIVNNENGVLLDKEITPYELAKLIEAYSNKLKVEFALLSKNSYSIFKQNFEMSLCKSQLINFINDL